jgi:hypothetical protein
MYHLYLLVGVDVAKKSSFQGLFEVDNPASDNPKPYQKALYFDDCSRIPFGNMGLFNQLKKECSLDELKQSFVEDFQGGEEATTEFFYAVQHVMSGFGNSKDGGQAVLAKKKELEKFLVVMTPLGVEKNENTVTAVRNATTAAAGAVASTSALSGPTLIPNDKPPVSASMGTLHAPSVMHRLSMASPSASSPASPVPQSARAHNPLPPIMMAEAERQIQQNQLTRLEDWLNEVSKAFHLLPITNGEQWNIRISIEDKPYSVCYTGSIFMTNYSKNLLSLSAQTAFGASGQTSLGGGAADTLLQLIPLSEDDLSASNQILERAKVISIVNDPNTNSCSIDWRNVADMSVVTEYLDNVWLWRSRIRRDENQNFYVKSVHLRWRDGTYPIERSGVVNISLDQRARDAYRIEWDDKLAAVYKNLRKGVIKIGSVQQQQDKVFEEMERRDRELIQEYCKLFWRPETHGVRNKVELFVRGKVYLLAYRAPNTTAHIGGDQTYTSYNNVVTVSITTETSNGVKSHHALFQNDTVKRMIEKYCTAFQDPPYTRLCIDGIKYNLNIAHATDVLK